MDRSIAVFFFLCLWKGFVFDGAQGRCYETIDGMAIAHLELNSSKTVENVTFEQCKKECDAVEEFDCNSLDFKQGSCFLTSQSYDEALGHMYISHKAFTYAQVTPCEGEALAVSSDDTKNEVTPSDSAHGRCYQLYMYKFLNCHMIIQQPGMTLEECLHACDGAEMEMMRCLSVNFLQSTGTCRLQSNNHLQVIQVNPSLLKVLFKDNKESLYAIPVDCNADLPNVIKPWQKSDQTTDAQ